LKQHYSALKSVELTLGDNTFTSQFTNIDNNALRASTTNFKSMKPITIDELLLNHVHKGKYLLCRSIAQPFKMTAISLIVEDRNGAVEKLSLYNYSNHAGYFSDLSHLIPNGAMLIIKDPYYKIASDGLRLIRCDNPSNVCLLKSNDPLLKEINFGSDSTTEPMNESNLVEMIKQQGNQCFKDKDYDSAIELYSKALSIDNKHVIILANRSLAYAHLRQWYNALSDAENALNIESNDLRALYRKAKALHGLKRYEEEVDALLRGVQKDPQNKEFHQSLIIAKQSIKEKSGSYKFSQIYEESLSEESPRLDHADYSHPHLRRESVEGKGLGLVATEDIEEGTLLMASKAFEISYENNTSFRSSMSFDWSRRKMYSQTHMEMVTSVIQRLKSEPQLKEIFYQLCDGERIDMYTRLSDTHSDGVDVQRVQAIVDLNAFETVSIDESQKGCGLWIEPSFFNHSCISNTCRHTIGDMMFVRASTKIRSGDEVTLSYCDPDASYNDRCRTLKSFHITCQCTLCTEERRSLDTQIALQELLNDAIDLKRQIQSQDPCVFPVLKRIIQLMKELSPRSHELLFPLTALAASYARCGKFQESSKLFEEAYSVSKNPIYTFRSAIHVADQYQYARDKTEWSRWYNMAKNIFSSNFANDDLYFQQVAERMSLY